MMMMIHIWFPMLWKGMELPAEGKLEQKPCRKETLKGNGESLSIAGER